MGNIIGAPNCPNCNGRGYTPGKIPLPDRDVEVLSSTVTLCHCAHTESNVIGIPARHKKTLPEFLQWWRESFTTRPQFSGWQSLRKQAIDAASRSPEHHRLYNSILSNDPDDFCLPRNYRPYGASWTTSQAFDHIIICGDRCTGRTTLAAALMRRRAENLGLSARFITGEDLQSLINAVATERRPAYPSLTRSSSDSFAELMDVGILLIDDWEKVAPATSGVTGGSLPTPSSQSLDRLLKGRYQRELPTMLVTRRDPRESASEDVLQLQPLHTEAMEDFVSRLNNGRTLTISMVPAYWEFFRR